MRTPNEYVEWAERELAASHDTDVMAGAMHATRAHVLALLALVAQKAPENAAEQAMATMDAWLDDDDEDEVD